MLRYLRIAVPELLPDGRYPSLDALSARCEARPEFGATSPADYTVPRSG
jgi:glutathione S-transferase